MIIEEKVVTPKAFEPVVFKAGQVYRNVASNRLFFCATVASQRKLALFSIVDGGSYDSDPLREGPAGEAYRATTKYWLPVEAKVVVL